MSLLQYQFLLWKEHLKFKHETKWDETRNLLLSHNLQRTITKDKNTHLEMWLIKTACTDFPDYNS